MTTDTRIDRPELTMPEAEATILREHYARAQVILEYGTGGSTALASELPGKTVFAVESDKDWALMMRAWLEQNPPASGTEVVELRRPITPAHRALLGAGLWVPSPARTTSPSAISRTISP